MYLVSARGNVATVQVIQLSEKRMTIIFIWRVDESDVIIEEGHEKKLLEKAMT